ncbi:glycoside hydrolase family 25 protein [Flavobacterium terrae]|uniref:Lysozyme n=1 Tax=Flavobacterium terrae TaxID=415425 RepID=A0A1M6GBL8_9FLAO|nr:GH25 family lysozyme [Flavobacterium terrae]SHJ07356.1 lysozyme [Flavobacterium terrae]
MISKYYQFSITLLLIALICLSAIPKNQNIDSTISGIDISHFQGDEIDYLNKKGSQLDFVICKATEGLTYTDPDFKSNWSMIKERGFVRGAYHFYHCADDPILQANYYLSVIGNLSSTDFPPIVDFEENSIDAGCNKSNLQKNLLQFLSILEQKTGRKPILYTDTNIGNAEIKDPAFANYKLWIADYNPGVSAAVPSVWKTTSWTIWQKTQSYSLDNYTNDFDVFNGDSETFAKVILGN